MRKDSPRYHEISASQFAHERAGLDQLRELVPDRAPFQVWTNFEFRDSQGKWHEVDALVLGERRLHLVELKHYQGQNSGNSYRWQRGRFSEDNPLILARRKAQRLASVIKDRLRELDPTGAAGPVPFIQESVYLHADNFRVVMADADLRDLFGPDDKTRATNLPSLAERLLEPVNAQSNKLIANDDLLVALFEKIGFGMRREREVGSWRLIEQIAEGAGWQDWAAEHKLMHARRARIRFFVTPPGAADSERARINALAKREYEVTTRLHHDGVARPEDIVEDETWSRTRLSPRRERATSRPLARRQQHQPVLGRPGQAGPPARRDRQVRAPAPPRPPGALSGCSDSYRQTRRATPKHRRLAVRRR